jgi:hypothetical protein
MINFSNQSNKECFLHEDLIKKTSWKSVQDCLVTESDPVTFAIAHNYVKTTSFYPNLARVFGLRFISDLPVGASSHASIIMRAPSELLSQLGVVVFEEEKKVCLAASTPFLDKKAMRELFDYLGTEEAELVVAHPSEIKNALQRVFYHEGSVSATARMISLFPEHSSKFFRNAIFPYIFPIGTSLAYLVSLIIMPYWVLLGTFILLNVSYFILNPYKLYIFFRSLNPTKVHTVTQEELKNLSDRELPLYTVMIPLKNEAVMVPNIVKNIFTLDYPPEKLDIKFICEVTDTETVEALRKEGVGQASKDASVEGVAADLVLVPINIVSTKPRSCNYAFSYARGMFAVIYDAEDRPDPDQLRKVVADFQSASLDTVCIQARLNFYNVQQNILTKFFSLEYSFWFDFFLPGSQEAGSAITLGGTSNHFISDALRKVGMWDPHNVTEDADLGLRLYRHEWQTGVVNSYTLEEANSQMINWLHQRTRWQKGFLLTFLVHAAHPGESIKKMGLFKFLKSLFAVSSNFFLPLLNPVLWVIFITGGL